MRSDFILALRQLADEKGIQIDAVMDALRTAVASAFEDFNTEYEDIDVEIEGGMYYGFGANFQNFQISYSISNLTMDLALNYNGQYESVSSDLEVTRMTISYLLN